MNRFLKSTSILIGTALTLAACIPGTNEGSGDNISNDNLASIEVEEYVFYYPNDYESYDNELQDASYRSLDENDTGGSNNIGLVVTPNEDIGAQPTQEDCDSISGQLAELLEGTVTESDVIDDGGMYGCSNTITAEFDGLSLISINKTVYEADAEEATVYSINATYEPTASEDEVKNLEDSVAKFKIVL